MAYKHILIAVDLSPESKVLVEKAVSMARPYNAKISLIHVDVNYSDLYTGLIDVNLGDMQKRISEETHHALTELSTNAGYPITETLSGSGDLGQVLVDAIKKYDMDLVVCGHHQDFWSKLMSSARQLINTVHVDMLIVRCATKKSNACRAGWRLRPHLVYSQSGWPEPSGKFRLSTTTPAYVGVLFIPLLRSTQYIIPAHQT